MPPDATDTRQPPAGPELWQGLEEYLDSAAFRDAMTSEFPENATEWVDPVSRRQFMALMGASLALAGAAGCSPRPAPMRKITPYTAMPEGMTPGVPLIVPSAATLAGYATGILAVSREGRPIKVEGNPDHPSSLGGCDTWTQASLLDLYDPDRSRRTTYRGGPIAYEEAITALRAKLFDAEKPRTDVKLRILTETVTSPTLAEQIEGLLGQFPNARWVQYDETGRDNVREGTRRAFGGIRHVHYDFTKADVVLSLDADFLTVGPGHVRYCHDFGTRRKVRQHHEDGVTEAGMSRLYAVECMPTSTGSVADHRLPLPAGQIEGFARALAVQLGVAGANGLPAGSLSDAAKAYVAALAKDLQAHAGKSLVVAGDHQPASLHALALALNGHLGNIGEGKPVIVAAPIEAPVAAEARGKVGDLRGLAGEIARKQVDVLLILGGNPAYTAPADLAFAETLTNSNTTLKLHLASHVDETSVACDYHIPAAHYLEAWGDGRGHDGTAAIQQPLIAPLYAGKSCIEFLADLTSAAIRDGYELVRARLAEERFPTDDGTGQFELFWRQALRSGAVPESGAKAEAATVGGTWSANASAAAASMVAGEYEVNFRLDPAVHDGRFANNGWLQEMPKPVTTLTWDNAVFVSPKTGRELGVVKDFRWTAGERGRAEVSVVELTAAKGQKVLAPIWVVPGHPDGAVTVHLGYGRDRAGRVGNASAEPNAAGQPTRGFNANALRTTAAPAIDRGLKITPTSDRYFLAIVQGNWSMVEKDPTSGKFLDRKPVHEMTLGQYRNDPQRGKIPPIAPGEAELIDANVPGSKFQANGKDAHNPSAAAEHDESGEEHDHRLKPLMMYRENETLTPLLPEAQRRKWAMAIDLSACTGCNACVMACVSENNIPVVGKREVTRGHEMHWIRVDRYYSGDPDDGAKLKTFFQPVPCQQCEKAPCEVVCPVGATVHSADGLNDMVYNRCVGTRYCSNNCPYKVRRFNFLTFQDWATESLKLGRNPEVSVRSRGVMEKCTYCVQRIRYAEIVAEREGARRIRDGEITTACQSACPSKAIMFGDLKDDASRVARWKSEPTNYGLLAELNTKPRTSYLASVRNPNPELTDALAKLKGA